MPVKIFASYSLKRAKSPGPLRGPFFMALAASQILRAKTQLAAFPFTQSALSCCGFFMALAAVIAPVESITSFLPVA